MTIPLAHPVVMAVAAGQGEPRVTIFFVQIVLLIVVGRLLGECMQRIDQPPVIGQLLAGIVLGPSLFGSVWPAAQQAIFPIHSSGRQMLDAISELGILLLLLLTGMETDLGLVKRVRRTAAITSGAGIAIPFICGYLLGQMLPGSLLPDPGRRLVTSLFLATALSISSVKIVAAVLREVDFLRRNLGQVILAAAILDDTIGWTILALISGLASQGKVVLGPILLSFAGTAAFLIFSFTFGSRLVARIIRWTNDRFISEMSVISVILVIMILLALATSFIGVNTMLGAFVGGIMIGQSPILTKHIEEELRGLIVALFMPVFFGVAGLSIDLKVLVDPRLLGLSVLFIAIASLGKLGGCYLGSRLARLNRPESLAVGFAMNARGSTDVILATIGLSMGVLNQQLFTIIVLMAVVTTLCMPPLLRWALVRVPVRAEEKARLEKEAAEENDLMPKIERVLVGLDASGAGHLVARLAGWFVGARRLTTTVVEIGAAGHEARAPLLIEAAECAAAAGVARDETPTAHHAKGAVSHPLEEAAQGAKAEKIPVRELISVLPPAPANAATVRAISEEAKNGYGLHFLGLGGEAEPGSFFPSDIEKIVREIGAPVAIPLHFAGWVDTGKDSLQRILVPTTGADYSRFGAEVAVAIARGSGATILAFHVSAPPTDNELLRHSKQLLRTGRALLADIVALGEREGVRVTAKTLVSPEKESAILRQAAVGKHQLIVIGTKAWTGDRLHFGESAAALIKEAPCPILIVSL